MLERQWETEREIQLNGCKTEREKETERQKDRKTERQTDRETERWRDNFN
jgi:hypothetical protein